jgi:hypothetical protein
MRSTILATGLILALAVPAFGQSPKAQSQNQQNQNQQTQSQQTQGQAQNRQSAQQRVQSDLQAAGFTDIRIMPESFLVRAKDKSGNPVMMVINPDSVAAVEFNRNTGSNTTGSGNQGANPRANSPSGQNPTGR